MTELARYARQIVLPEVGVNGQSLLADSHALIVGLGGLGSVAAAYLAGAGVGHLTLMDHDRVDTSNLQRQILYTQDDVGRDKALAAQSRLRAVNHDIAIDAIVAKADAANLGPPVRAADIVLDCSDNFPVRFAINAACVAARRVLVFAAALRFEAQLAVFDAARGGPCYRCLYTDDEATHQIQERCEDAGVLGPVVGMAGSMQALLALKALLGIGRPFGHLHLLELSSLKLRSVRIQSDPACPVCSAIPAHTVGAAR